MAGPFQENMGLPDRFSVGQYNNLIQSHKELARRVELLESVPSRPNTTRPIRQARIDAFTADQQHFQGQLLDGTELATTHDDYQALKIWCWKYPSGGTGTQIYKYHPRTITPSMNGQTPNPPVGVIVPVQPVLAFVGNDPEVRWYISFPFMASGCTR